MRAPRGGGEGGGAAGFGGPLIVVILVLLLGGTIYLWRLRYIRTRTAYITMAVLTVALILSGLALYTSGM